jgi:hypothetical protein
MVPVPQNLSGHGVQRRLGVTGVRNSLIPVAAKFPFGDLS